MKRDAPLAWLLLSGGFLLLATWLAGCTAESAGQRAAPRPNIVVVLADDLGVGDLGSYNAASKIPTPHLDALAAEGMRFTDAHTPSSVCTPTRYGLLTGRYAWRTRLKKGVLWGYSPSLIDTQRTTVASFLKQHGYHTAAIGKWHLGLGRKDSTDYAEPLRPGPNQLGFDYFYGIPASLDMIPYVYVENERVVELPTDTTGGSTRQWKGGGGFWRAGPIAPGFEHREVLPRITEKAVGYIEQQARREAGTPFFLYFPLSAPHTPWLPAQAFRGTSEAGPYGDFAVQVDHSIGQIIKALDRLTLAGNTLLIVTSDNGAHWPRRQIQKYKHQANGRWRGQKADIWEGGHRVPFIARWPGQIPAGTASDETLCLTDLLATSAAALGAELPPTAGPDSYNMLPAMLGTDDERPLREATVHHSLDGLFAIRQGPWKLIEGRGSGGFTAPARRAVSAGDPQGQLYHLADDPGETNNLYVEQPEIVRRLQALLDRYRKTGRSRPE